MSHVCINKNKIRKYESTFVSISGSTKNATVLYTCINTCTSATPPPHTIIVRKYESIILFTSVQRVTAHVRVHLYNVVRVRELHTYCTVPSKKYFIVIFVRPSSAPPHALRCMPARAFISFTPLSVPPRPFSYAKLISYMRAPHPALASEIWLPFTDGRPP